MGHIGICACIHIYTSIYTRGFGSSARRVGPAAWAGIGHPWKAEHLDALGCSLSVARRVQVVYIER
eukprot:2351708-Alexandrium_andersonii.AAC.1